MRSLIVSLLASAHRKAHPNQAFVFVMGHMRSGSSLLTHFLQSCPNVSGYGESNATYEEEADLHKLAVRAKYRMAKNRSGADFFVDQINHNSKTPDSDLFASANLKLIVIARKPQASISSIIRLNREHYDGAWSAEQAVDYYIKRIRFLAKLSYSANLHFVRYEDLLDQTEESLKGIEAFLGIKFPSYTEYKLNKQTGTSGDPGSKIREGKIVRSKSPLVEMEDELLQKAKGYYEDFLREIAS